MGMTTYPIYLQDYVEISNENEIENMKKFFNVENFKLGKYILCLMVLGDEEENFQQLIPIGKMMEICLVSKNTVKYSNNIEDVFDFELSDGDYNNQREFIKEWFYKIKTN